MHHLGSGQVKPHHLCICSHPSTLHPGPSAHTEQKNHFEVSKIHKGKVSHILSLWIKKLRLGFLIFIGCYLKGNPWVMIILVESVCLLSLFLLQRWGLPRSVTKRSHGPTGWQLGFFSSLESFSFSFSFPPLFLPPLLLLNTRVQRDLENLTLVQQGRRASCIFFVWGL